MNYYRTNKNDFHDWLQHHIWTTSTEKEARKHYIPYLYDDITDWMFDKGYEMDYRWNNRGPLIVAKWLYAIHVNEKALKLNHEPLNYPEIIHRDWEEDKDRFDFIMDIKDIEAFFYEWRHVDDFDMETHVGRRVRGEFLTFLYTYIDLDSSKQGRYISKKLEPDSESENETGQETFDDLMSGAFGTTKKIIGYNTL
jgi:hypothetical protein